jgi:hypothetical protein
MNIATEIETTQGATIHDPAQSLPGRTSHVQDRRSVPGSGAASRGPPAGVERRRSHAVPEEAQAAPPDDALDRLGDEGDQIDELFVGYADRQLRRAGKAFEPSRVPDLICTLLRVHEELESTLLDPALARTPGVQVVLERARASRDAVRDEMERVEALAPTDPAYESQMASLARHARAWFDDDEAEVFELARRSGTDLVALDVLLGIKQEALLSADPPLG